MSNIGPGGKGSMDGPDGPHPGVIGINVAVFLISNLLLVPLESYYAKKIHDNRDSLVMYVIYYIPIIYQCYQKLSNYANTEPKESLGMN